MASSTLFDTLTGADAQFATDDFDPELKDWSFVHPLIVGAGGIGCELLHLLALSGFNQLTVIDMDFIELSNLNRQFLFTQADIGKSKSAVAAAAVMARCPHVTVTAVVGRLEEQPDAFYEDFDVILLAVDSIPARRWMNRKVAQLASRTIVPAFNTSAAATTHSADSTLTSSYSAASTAAAGAAPSASIVNPVRSVGLYVIDEAKPIIDTGTEGFEGHCRVVNLRHNTTPCIECEMYLYNDGATRKTVPLCTLESVPRAPEHCVLYVQMKEWPEERGGGGRGNDSNNDASSTAETASQHARTHHGATRSDDAADGVLNPDNPEHVHWVAQRARARQEKFGIGGPPIDDMFTLGVIKNVVPAVGFTNAYVAGQAVTETLKWLTGCAPPLNNFAFFNGATESGVFTDVQQCCGAPMAGGGDVNGRCLVCGPRPVVAVHVDRVTPAAFVEGLITALTTQPAVQTELRRGTASIVFQAQRGDGGGVGVVEVNLPRLGSQHASPPFPLPSSSSLSSHGDAEATAAAAAAAAASVVSSSVTAEQTLAEFLVSAGHADFVQQWRDGAQMATVECFGGSEARLSALVQWDV